jgi:PBSX family phage terminase large subunit
MIQATTSLRKIAALRKKIRVVRGGQGSGKTISILILLINHAYNKQDREILILSAELTKMRLTVIKDFIKVMKIMGLYEDERMIAGTLYRFPNGSFIKFIGLDKTDVGKGLRSHVAYFNEVNKVDAESYRQIASRADQVYMDYNPDASFFVDADVIPRADADFLQLTFRDNELLPTSERDEILNYYKLGYNEDGTILNAYWANLWQVYGLGNIGSLQGVVLPNWEIVDKVDQRARKLFTGVDFGFSVSKFAALDIYTLNGQYILDELVYDNNLTNPDAARRMIQAGYTRSHVAWCDHAEPKSIEELRRSGIKAMPCESKTDLKAYAIKKLNEKKFFITKRSTNLAHELRHLVWDERAGKPAKSNADHLTDALFYAIGSGEKYQGRYSIGGV